MKDIFTKIIQFIKENPGIIFSLVLLVLIPTAFFINTYLTNKSYENAINTITYSKTALVEYVMNSFLQEKIADDQLLQSAIDRIMNEESSITLLSIIKKNDRDEYKIVASSDKSLVGQTQKNTSRNNLAWERLEGIAFLDESGSNRFWNVTKLVFDGSGNKAGLISMDYSIRDSDAIIQKTINNSYWILILTIIIVILMVSNQARLFGYALTLTKLKEIDKMKDMFISMASHELRSPLTAIKGYLEFLKEKKEVFEDKESNQYVTNISISVDRLNNLVEDMLEVSRIEGNRLPMEIKTLDPEPVILQTVEEMRSQAEKKNLAFNYKSSEIPATVSADPERLKQILINFISNAIKYTEKGSIEVNSLIRDNYFLITVADTGMGISSENQANLFQRFYRIQNDKTKGIIGTGLGLWITQEIARKMKGKITLESIEGVGSHFTLYLPINKK